MPAVYFRILLREYGKTSSLRAAILEDTGVTNEQLLEPNAEITLGQQVIQIRNLTRLLGTGWWLALGRLLEVPAHGTVGIAILTAPTLGRGMEAATRYAHVNTPLYRIRSRLDADEFSLVVEEHIQLSADDRIPLLETLMLALQAVVETVLGRSITDARVEFDYAPTSYRDRYSGHFRARVQFDAPSTRLAMPAQWMEVPSLYSNPVMHESALAQLDTLARRLESPEFLLTRVAQAVEAGGDGGLSLREAARHLRVSRRTLIRRLAEAGSSYREMRDAHRRTRAQALLEDGELSIGEVARRVGYEDQSNFARACQRWFGAAPRSVRRAASEPARSQSGEFNRGQ